MIAFSPVSSFEVYLPVGEGPSSSLQLLIYIRDSRDCLTEWNLTSIIVQPERNAFVDLLYSSPGSLSNPFVRLVSTSNQNRVGQVLSSVSQQLNQVDDDNLQQAISSQWTLLSLLIDR